MKSEGSLKITRNHRVLKWPMGILKKTPNSRTESVARRGRNQLLEGTISGIDGLGGRASPGDAYKGG